MTHDRPAHPRRYVADRVVRTQPVACLSSWKVPVTVVALGLSVIVHGGLLTAAYFVAWSPARLSHPKISFAQGDQATRVQVLLVPWPEPAEEEETKQVPPKDTPAAEMLAEPINVEKVEAVPEDVVPESGLDPPAAASEERDPSVNKEPEVAEVPVLHDVREAPPAADVVEATSRRQSVEAILGHVIHQLARFFTPPETSEPVERPPLPVAEVVEEAAAPLNEEAAPSKASASQTAGVETGVKMLDLPTPKYPALSRRQGEEGVVLLQVEVLPDGAVGDITVLQDAGFRRLAEAAVSAARRGRFEPATRNGHPVRDTVRIPFRFVLR